MQPWSSEQVGEVVKRIDITYKYGRQWDPCPNMLKHWIQDMHNEELTKPCIQAYCGKDNLCCPKDH